VNAFPDVLRVAPRVSVDIAVGNGFRLFGDMVRYVCRPCDPRPPPPPPPPTIPNPIPPATVLAAVPPLAADTAADAPTDAVEVQVSVPTGARRDVLPGILRRRPNSTARPRSWTPAKLLTAWFRPNLVLRDLALRGHLVSANNLEPRDLALVPRLFPRLTRLRLVDAWYTRAGLDQLTTALPDLRCLELAHVDYNRLLNRPPPRETLKPETGIMALPMRLTEFRSLRPSANHNAPIMVTPHGRSLREHEDQPDDDEAERMRSWHKVSFGGGADQKTRANDGDGDSKAAEREAKNGSQLTTLCLVDGNYMRLTCEVSGSGVACLPALRHLTLSGGVLAFGTSLRVLLHLPTLESVVLQHMYLRAPANWPVDKPPRDRLVFSDLPPSPPPPPPPLPLPPPRTNMTSFAVEECDVPLEFLSGVLDLYPRLAALRVVDTDLETLQARRYDCAVVDIDALLAEVAGSAAFRSGHLRFVQVPLLPRCGDDDDDDDDDDPLEVAFGPPTAWTDGGDGRGGDDDGETQKRETRKGANASDESRDRRRHSRRHSRQRLPVFERPPPLPPQPRRRRGDRAPEDRYATSVEYDSAAPQCRVLALETATAATPTGTRFSASAFFVFPPPPPPPPPPTTTTASLAETGHLGVDLLGGDDDGDGCDGDGGHQYPASTAITHVRLARFDASVYMPGLAKMMMAAVVPLPPPTTKLATITATTTTTTTKARGEDDGPPNRCVVGFGDAYRAGRRLPELAPRPETGGTCTASVPRDTVGADHGDGDDRDDETEARGRELTVEEEVAAGEMADEKKARDAVLKAQGYLAIGRNGSGTRVCYCMAPRRAWTLTSSVALSSPSSSSSSSSSATTRPAKQPNGPKSRAADPLWVSVVGVDADICAATHYTHPALHETDVGDSRPPPIPTNRALARNLAEVQ
jgi:hypothetical protein